MSIVELQKGDREARKQLAIVKYYCEILINKIKIMYEDDYVPIERCLIKRRDRYLLMSEYMGRMVYHLTDIIDQEYDKYIEKLNKRDEELTKDECKCCLCERLK